MGIFDLSGGMIELSTFKIVLLPFPEKLLILLLNQI
jgi:hypothetical protein